MCSAEFSKSISLMRVSNSEMIFSEKDLNVSEFMNSFLVRSSSRHPTLERHQINCRLKDRDGGQGVVADHHHHHHENEDDEIVMSKENINININNDNNNNKEDDDRGDKFEVLVSSLKLKIPTRNNVEQFMIRAADHDDQKNTMKGNNNRINYDDDNHHHNDGFKTPTSVDTKIPVILPCPPAPRKPKSTIQKTKRKVNQRPALLDLTTEIESLFPPTVLADLGAKIKKVRQSGNANTNLLL
ncbi:hypothetical protein CsatB_029810 [Cannabis sativa]